MASKFISLLTLVLSAALVAAPAFAQEQDDEDPARAARLINDAIKARGGEAYGRIKVVVSRGQFTPFEKGESGLPNSVVDYIVYPDRERTEFGKGDSKFIQTNSGASGWIYDAKQKMIREQTDEQIKRFQQGIRFELDNLLINGWKEPGVKLVYLGRREVWRNTFSEAVRLDFADGASVTLHFDTRSKLPLMSEYKAINEGQTENVQARYFRWIENGGIQFPTIIDFFREGKQTARVSIDNVTFNAPVPDNLFAKPASVKEVK